MKKLIIYSIGKGLFKFEIIEPNPLEPQVSFNSLHTFFNFGKIDFIFHNDNLKIEHPEVLEEFDFSNIELCSMYGNPTTPNSLEEVVIFLKERGFGCCFETIIEEPEKLPIKIAGFINEVTGQKSYYSEPKNILVDNYTSFEFPLHGNKITNTDGFDFTNEAGIFIFINQNGVGEEIEIFLNNQSIVSSNQIL